LFIWGVITLVGGNFGQLVIPYYVGLFADRISQKKFDEVYGLCWQLVLINLVSVNPNRQTIFSIKNLPFFIINRRLQYVFSLEALFSI
jgi:hypothetical protein